MNSGSFSSGDMSLITDERASRARLREIQRLTPAIQKARVRKNARRQESRALSLQWIWTNPGVGYAACRFPAACLPRSVTMS